MSGDHLSATTVTVRDYAKADLRLEKPRRRRGLDRRTRRTAQRGDRLGITMLRRLAELKLVQQGCAWSWRGRRRSQPAPASELVTGACAGRTGCRRRPAPSAGRSGDRPAAPVAARSDWRPRDLGRCGGSFADRCATRPGRPQLRRASGGGRTSAASRVCGWPTSAAAWCRRPGRSALGRASPPEWA